MGKHELLAYTNFNCLLFRAILNEINKVKWLMLLLFTPLMSFGQQQDINLNVLVGEWRLDLSPQDKSDSNFASIDYVNYLIKKK
ncbi:MAG: hypothetical protein CMC20_03455 [Flavobacteriaceae bacterium]|nr:hypothetical protein [Flavobacteriaceae bacterium]OUV85966.1 MAG: hypothetical protein CBD05_03305 [Flavobacteriaceae bacterium TMED145]